jgi:hypothetical protein
MGTNLIAMDRIGIRDGWTSKAPFREAWLEQLRGCVTHFAMSKID